MKTTIKLFALVVTFLGCKVYACDKVTCTIFCQYGHVIVKNCETCECVDPCRGIKCFYPYVCAANPYNCTSSGVCLSNPKCVKSCPLIKCRPCPYGYVIDKYGCQTCTCIEPCKKHKCKWDEHCQVETVPCRDSSNCGYKPKCVKRCPSLECPLLDCRYGYEVNCHNCPICKCSNPCKGVVCNPYHYCSVQIIFCLIPPCPPPTAICDSYCGNNALLLDDKGIPISCSTRKCPNGYTCKVILEISDSFCCAD